MKKLLTLALASFALLAGCESDDSALRNQLDDHKERLEALEARMAALETLAGELNAALDDNLSIAAYTELPGGKGWRITFSDGSSLEVTDGLDGADGQNGLDGRDGTNGTNGADGQDGRDGTDGRDGRDGTNGTNGTNGADGDSLIESIGPGPDGNSIVIELANNTTYRFPKATEITASGDTTNGQTWTLHTDGTLTISGGGNIPNYNDTNNRAPWMAYAAQIKAVVIVSGVEVIGSNAFRGCTNIVSVTIPDSVQRIGSDAFRDCSGLVSVIIPNSVTVIMGGAFQGCSSLESVVIPNRVMEIGISTFQGCSSLVSVTIPDGMQRIYNNAFRDCSSLASLIIPDRVTNIYNNAFAGCSSLTSVTVLAASPNNLDDNNFTAGGDALFVPAGSEDDYKNSAWAGAFSAIVTVPDAQGVIASGTAGTLSWWIKVDGSLQIYGPGAMPDYNHNNPAPWNYYAAIIKSVVISDNVASIGAGAFRGLSNLASVTIPPSVTSIGDNAFRGCTNLTGVAFANGVTTIGVSAFEGCRGLTYITLPLTVRNIEKYAFYGCNNLTSVTVRAASPPTLDPDNFETGGETLYVPAASLSAYQDPSKAWAAAFTEIVGLP